MIHFVISKTFAPSLAVTRGWKSLCSGVHLNILSFHKTKKKSLSHVKKYSTQK